MLTFQNLLKNALIWIVKVFLVPASDKNTLVDMGFK